jgi:hypothetical protein
MCIIIVLPGKATYKYNQIDSKEKQSGLEIGSNNLTVFLSSFFFPYGFTYTVYSNT